MNLFNSSEYYLTVFDETAKTKKKKKNWNRSLYKIMHIWDRHFLKIITGLWIYKK